MRKPVRLRLALLPAALWLIASSAEAAPTAAAFAAQVSETKQAMMRDPRAALAKADAVAALARTFPVSREGRIAMATGLWLQGEAHIYLNEPAIAIPFVDRALQHLASEPSARKLQGDLLRSRGATAAMLGRAQDALRDFQRAYNLFAEAREPRSQAMALQDIGQIYWDAGDYPRTLQYYAQSSEIYDKDPVLLTTNHNNRGEVLRKLGRLEEAQREYEAALAQARKMKSAMLEVRILTNIAFVQVDRGLLQAAEATVARELEKTVGGEASGERPFVLGVAAKLAWTRGDSARAAALLDQTFAGVDLTKTEMQYREFHQLAATVLERQGDAARALQHMKAYQRLDSLARSLTATTSSQLMSARFDFANQNLRIAKLKQGQLQADIALERQRSHMRTILFAGSLGIGGLVLVMLTLGLLSLRRSRNATRAANIELRRVNDELEHALKAKIEFLATTSHEIRTPLNGILGMTQVLLANDRLDHAVRERVEVVHGAGETMRALVDDLLDVAKMETGRLEVAHQPTPVARILTDAVGLWGAHASNKQLTVTLETDDVPPVMLSDETRLRQIVFNLMSNAVKFTEQGTITLRARTLFEAGEEMFELTVEDTGIGIAPEQQALVFEAFHQVDGSTVRQFAGTGLGLAICRHLAEIMGGSLDLRSELGRGSAFILRLPLHRPVAAARPQAARRALPQSLAEAALLIVDPNPMSSGAVGVLLEPHVGELATVETLLAARDLIDDDRATHLLIEGAALLHEGSFELAPDTLRGLLSPGLRVTLLVTPNDTLDLARLAALPGMSVILKPVGGKALLAALVADYGSTSASPSLAHAA